MSINLVEIIGRELSGAIAGKVASVIGASPQAATAGVGAAVPAILGGLLNTGSSSQGAGAILDMLTKGNHDGILGNLAGALDGGDGTKGLLNAGGGILSSILGTRGDAVTGYIANASGLGRGASSSMLSLLAPIVLGFITRQLKSSGGLSLSSLTGLLSSQKSALEAAPAGLASALGVTSLSSLGNSAANAVAPVVTEGRSWTPWILGALALAAVLFFSRSCNRAETVAPAPEPVAAPAVIAPVETPPVVSGPAPLSDGLVEKALADGRNIRIAAEGVESKLIGFIEDSSKAVDKTTWFTFDRLEFETGSANLKPASSAQLGNIAAILKAYPNVNLKLGGYTDNTGHATQEGRQKNRRIDVRVSKK